VVAVDSLCRLSRGFVVDVDSALHSLLCVNMGGVAGVSDVYTIFIFRE
jgi:hypothetical protein